MIRLRTLVTGSVVALLGLIGSSATTAASSEGQYKDLLIRVLTANARGECPGDLMSVLLQDACERQMPNMKPQFDRLGKLQSARYRGIQQSQGGPAEVYRVSFENGEMTWMINTGPDGKILVLFSPG